MIPKNYIWLVLAVIGVAFATVIISSARFGLSFLETISTAQLAFTVLAFGFFLYALYATIVQLRKTTAKPKLSLAFSEDGKTKTTIENISTSNIVVHKLNLWIINTGNAVAKLFQIDLEVPAIFNPNIDVSINKRLSPKGNITIISLYNKENIISFVNRPAKIPSLVLEFSDMNLKNYRNQFEIKIEYKIFGDWAETQEGKLEIICKKKQEVLNAEG